MTILQVFSPFFILRDYFLYFVHLESAFGNCVAVNNCYLYSQVQVVEFPGKILTFLRWRQFFLYEDSYMPFFISCLVKSGSPLDRTEIFFYS